MKKTVLIIFATILATTNLFSQEYYLKYNLSKGKVYTLKSDGKVITNMSMKGQNIEMKQSIKYYLDFKAENISSNDMNIAAKNKRMVMDIDIPHLNMTKHYDTNSPDSSPEMTAIQNVIGKSIKAKVRLNGEVIGTVDLSEYKSILGENSKSSSIMPIVYPKHPVKIGDEWSAAGSFNMDINQMNGMDVLYKYKLKNYDAKKKIYTIEISGNLDIESNGIPIKTEMHGFMYVDANTGLPISSSKIDISGEIDSYIKGMKFKAKISGYTYYGWEK